MALPQLWMLAGLALVTCFALSTEAGFVTRTGHQLHLDGKPLYYVGANAYWLMDQAKYEDKRYQVDQFFKYCQKWGLKMIRIWGYNHNSPKAKGVYDDAEMKGFDYIIKSASENNIKLIIALGNTWSAYRSPEDMMRIAGIDPKGKDLLDYYRSEAVNTVYKDHMYTMVNRRNVYTGVVYKNDPTIAIWDVINEPRCPGCTEDWQQRIHLAWLSEMTAFLKAQAPNQLVAVGTEGYFMPSAGDDSTKWNPGAGTQCEGENWTELNRDRSIDVTTIHVYDRQMESVPPTWRRPDYDDLLHWFVKYLDAHEHVSRSLGKPMVMEEFNVIMPTFTPAQRTILFRVVLDYLQWQQSVGGSLSGVMFWNAAIGSDVWDDGYNIYLDVPDQVVPPPTQPPASSDSGSSTPSGSEPSAPADPPKVDVPVVTEEPERKPVAENTETLGDFRRGPQRDACAEVAAKTWLPAWDQPWARTVDVAAYTQRVEGRRVQDVLRDTTWYLASK